MGMGNRWLIHNIYILTTYNYVTQDLKKEKKNHNPSIILFIYYIGLKCFKPKI